MGRVERMNKTLQSRLYAELVRNKITTITDANTFLETFIPTLCADLAKDTYPRFNAHIHVVATKQLNRAFAYHQERVLTNDWTIRLHNRSYQLKKPPKFFNLQPGKKIRCLTYLDKHLELVYNNKNLLFEEVLNSYTLIE